jgi:pimeloyl-ACP methyl ester carboxylesterase
MQIKWKWIFLVLTIVWVISAPACMQMRITDEAAKAEFNKQKKAIRFENSKINNRTIHYAVTGKETLPTIVFIHGSPGSWDAFKRYLADSLLSEKFRMISIDRPGFGYSDFGDAMGLEEQVPLLFAAIEQEKNGQPFHLVGHSIGGPVVIKMIQDFPGWFASATILAGSIAYAHEPKEYWRYPLRYFPLRYLLPGALRPSNDEIVDFKKELKIVDKNYHKITTPVVFMHGDKDGFVSIKNMLYGEQQLKGKVPVEAITIHGANHFIPWTYYELIRNKLLELN